MPQGEVGFVPGRRCHDAECNERSPDPRDAYTMSRMGKKPKSAYDLAMERLGAADRESGVKEIVLSDAQKKAIAEARSVAASRLAEQEILFRDVMKKNADPAERDKAEEEYRIDRQRIADDCDRAIEAIRRSNH
jgi:hypothetical protein